MIKACSNKGGGAGPHFMLEGDIYLNSNIERKHLNGTKHNGL